MFGDCFRPKGREGSRATVLSGNPFFRDLSRRELGEVESILQERKCEPGETVFQQGEPDVGMYILLSGAVEISQKDEEGLQVRLTRVNPGAYFGEMALLDDAPRTASAVAVEASEVAVFLRTDLLSLAEQRPQLGVKIVMHLSQIVADRLRRTNQALKEVRAEVEATQGGPTAAAEVV